MINDLAYQASAAVLQATEVDAQTDTRWEAFVTAHPDGLIYHHPAWLKTLEREYGQKFLCLLCKGAAGSCRGVLSLAHTRGLPFRKRGELTGRRLSSLPRTPVAGPLALDDEATAALVRYPVWVEDRAATLRLAAPHAVLGDWFTSVLEEAVNPSCGDYEMGACPRAEAAARHLVNLPTHPRVYPQDVRAIAKAVARAASVVSVSA